MRGSAVPQTFLLSQQANQLLFDTERTDADSGGASWHTLSLKKRFGSREPRVVDAVQSQSLTRTYGPTVATLSGKLLLHFNRYGADSPCAGDVPLTRCAVRYTNGLFILLATDRAAGKHLYRFQL